MRQSSPLDSGLDVQKASMAVASGSNDHDAEVVYLGTSGPRPCDLDHLVRKRQSTAQHWGFVCEAGPCGSWLDRYLTNQG